MSAHPPRLAGYNFMRDEVAGIPVKEIRNMRRGEPMPDSTTPAPDAERHEEER